MSQPLLATDRLSFHYQVDGLNHVYRGYCDDGGLDTDGNYGVLDRGGVITLNLQAVADFWWSKASGYLAAGVVIGPVIHEKLTGVVWNPVSVVVPATPTLTGTPTHAAQLTVVMRDTAFKKIRVVLMEGRGGYVAHTPNGIGMPASIDAFIASYTLPSIDPLQPYNWVRSRGDRNLLSSGTVAGATLDLNDRIKRDRGLA